MTLAATLHRLRTARGLTLEKLAEESGVNKATIHRLEQGKITVARDHTVHRLASALRVKPEVLRGLEPAPAYDPLLDNSSDLTMRLNNAARNALALAAKRYRVPPSRIQELAPFLFVWAAESSLRRRGQRLDDLERDISALASHQGRFPHLSALLTYNTRAEDIMAAEQTSIAERDLFGSKIPFDGGEVLNSDCDEGEDNPFAQFLRDLADDVDLAFGRFGSMGPPSYRVCQEEAAELVGDDEAAAAAILCGAARLHERPRNPPLSSAKDWADWAKSQKQLRDEEFKAEYPELWALLQGSEGEQPEVRA